jgi:hypothetical protein
MKKILKEWNEFLERLNEQEAAATNPPETVDWANLGKPGSGVSFGKPDPKTMSPKDFKAATEYRKELKAQTPWPDAPDVSDILKQKSKLEKKGFKPHEYTEFDRLEGGHGKWIRTYHKPGEGGLSPTIQGEVEERAPVDPKTGKIAQPGLDPTEGGDFSGQLPAAQPKATTGRPQATAASLLSDISSAEKSRMDVVNANRNPAPMSYAHKMLTVLQQKYGDEFGDWIGMKGKYDPRGKNYKKGTMGYRDQQNMWRGEKLDPKKVKSLVAVANDRDGDQAESLYALRKLYQAGEYDAIKQLLWKPAAR